MTTEASAIIRLTNVDAADVVDVLCEAFFDYPVMRYVIGPGDDYSERLRLLVELFVAARTMRNDVMFGARDGSQLIAAVTTSIPADPAHPEYPGARAQTWQQLGEEAEKRYDLCVQAWTSISVDRPQLHVNMIGVRNSYRGTGLGRRLLDAAHRLCEQLPGAEGVTLTTEVPGNVEFYRHLGYDVVGQARVADVLDVWCLFRPK